MSPSRPPSRDRALLKVAIAPGTAPTKWFRRFDERVPGWGIAWAIADDPWAPLRSNAIDLAILRLADASSVPDAYHCVDLYAETVGVAVPKEHIASLLPEAEALPVAELADDMLLGVHDATTPADVALLRENLGVVGANVGCVIAPQPVLRSINARGVLVRRLGEGDISTLRRPPHLEDAAGAGADASLSSDVASPAAAGAGAESTNAADGGGVAVPQTRVVLVWKRERDDEVIQAFVGICRGRKAGTSRNAEATLPASARKGTARGAAGKSAAKAGVKGAKGVKGVKGARGASGKKGKSGGSKSGRRRG